ncbi:MAG: PD-(D/E)XK nuclease family protein [Planktothrix sp. GU0601_MAG3]|nr:MAG: PD-(D/E)XK nuclease family protein [Planktothrix sp. GU0601_MAG3]
MTQFRLSQQHLNLLSLCPRKFQYTYLDQLVSPTSPETGRTHRLGKSVSPINAAT